MPKFTKKALGSGFASTDDLDENFANLETFSDNTLSRDGTSPNAMGADLDMNSNRIINLDNAQEASDAVNKAQLDAASGDVTTTQVENQSTNGGATYTATTLDYVPGVNQLSIYVDGVYQREGVDYTEQTGITSGATQITFGTAPPSGLPLTFVVNGTRSVSSGVVLSSNIQGDLTYNQGGTGATDRTYTNRLQDTVSVKDFGATGDGVTDDTVAIQAAIDSRGNFGRVFFPAGNYLTTASLNISTLGLELIGDQATITNTTTTLIYITDPGRQVKLDNLILRGDTDTSQTIEHLLDDDPNFDDNKHLFIDYAYNAGAVTEPNTGISLTIGVPTDMATVRAAVHCRVGRILIHKCEIEGFEAGVALEGVSISKLTETRIRFCKTGIMTDDDRTTPALKVTMLRMDQCVIEYIHCGIYGKELQDSLITNSFITRTNLVQYYNNCTAVVHKKLYIESQYQLVLGEGSFTGDLLFEDLHAGFVSETNPFINWASGAADPATLRFVRPVLSDPGTLNITVNSGDILEFDKHYRYLPRVAADIYITDERNEALFQDPKFTRGGFPMLSVGAGLTSITLVHDAAEGNYLSIVGNGGGAAYNGVQVAIRPVQRAPTNEDLPVRIYYEYQYDDAASGDTIEYPFGVFIGSAWRSGVVNITDTDGEWKIARTSVISSGNISHGTRFSGGFNGTLKIRNFYVSLGQGHAYNYTPNPTTGFIYSTAPANGDWVLGDFITQDNPTAGGKAGFICVTSGSPGTWKAFGAIDP